jgi:hypothetical protein
MMSSFGRGDLQVGGLAAAALLLLVVPLGVAPWLAIPLAVATYAGLVLLRPGRQRRDATIDDARRQQLAYEAALANAAAIRSLAPRIAKPAVREQIGRILDRTARVLVVMREDRNLVAAPLFNEQVLKPFVALLSEYVHLSARGVRSADGLLAKTETGALPMIEQAVGDFYEHLHRGSLIDLAALGEVLELNLESIPAMTPRRPRP